MNRKRTLFIWLLLALTAPPVALADALTRIVQEDLKELGYDPGRVDGEFSTKTAIAVSQFEADHGLDVTGEVTPQLAGKIKAAMKGTLQSPGSAPKAAAAVPAAKPAAPAPAPSAQDMQARQQACLQEKMAAAQENQKKKRGFGSLMRAASRVGQRFGMGSDIAQVTQDVYDVNATASDLSSAAEDLGLTQDDIEACRNPAGAGAP